MQNVSPDGSKKKALFTKRIHRPWNTNLEAPVLIPMGEAGVPSIEGATHPLRKTTPPTEPCAIQAPSATHTEAVLIGGFFYQAQHSGQNPAKGGAINDLMQELRAKEQEILLLDHDLQIANALEEARKAEAAQNHEVTARKSAEENALFAIQKAKLAIEQSHQAETQVLEEKKMRLELERTKKALEERLQQALQTIAQKDTEKLELEAAQKGLEEKWMILKTQMDGRISVVQKESERKIKEAQEHIAASEKAKLNAQSFTQKTMETLRQNEVSRLALEEQLETLQQKNAAQLEEIQAMLLQNKEEVEALMLQRKHAQENQAMASTLLAQALERSKNLEAIIETEKALRMHCEEKMTESHVRKEEAKRKLSEDKFILMEQAMADLEAEKSRIEEKLFKTQRSIRNLEIMRLSSE